MQNVGYRQHNFRCWCPPMPSTVSETPSLNHRPQRQYETVHVSTKWPPSAKIFPGVHLGREGENKNKGSRSRETVISTWWSYVTSHLMDHQAFCNQTSLHGWQYITQRPTESDGFWAGEIGVKYSTTLLGQGNKSL